MLVDCGRANAGHTGKHLCGASGGGQEHRLYPQPLEIAYDGSQGRSLAGTGIAVHHEDVSVVCRKELPQAAEKGILARRRFYFQQLEKTVMERCGIHQRLRRSKSMATTASTG